MKTQAIVPAELDFNADGIPCSAAYGDIYHPACGAAVQANHVFVGGSDLPRRWQGRDSFVILETGFGLGSNFVATWNAWRHDPSACQRLHFISIESSPLRGDALRSLWRDPACSRSPRGTRCRRHWRETAPESRRSYFPVSSLSQEFPTAFCK